MESTLKLEYSASTNELGHVQIKWAQWICGRNKSSSILNAFASLCFIDFFLIVLPNFEGFSLFFWFASVASGTAYLVYLAAKPTASYVTVIPGEGVILQSGTQISLGDIINIEVKTTEIKNWRIYKSLIINVAGVDVEIARTSDLSTLAESLKFKINKCLMRREGDHEEANK